MSYENRKEFVCYDCNLTFTSAESFYVHRNKFCLVSNAPRSRNFDFAGLSVTNKGRYPGESRALQDASFSWRNDGEVVRERKMYSPARAEVLHRPRPYVSRLDHLKAEQDKLEEHRQAIQQRLGSLGANHSSFAVSPRQGAEKDIQSTDLEKAQSLDQRLQTLRQYINQLHSEKGNASSKSRFVGNWNNSPGMELQRGTRPLQDDIAALRREYIQQGGNDMGVLSNLHELEVDIKEVTSSTQRGKADANIMIEDLKSQLLAYQLCNQRLQFDLQQATQNRAKQGETVSQVVAKYEPLPAAGRSKVDFHEQRLLEIKQEVEFYRQQLELERLRAELDVMRGAQRPFPKLAALPPAPSQIPQVVPSSEGYQVRDERELFQVPQMLRRLSMKEMASDFVEKRNEAFQPAPYDPAGGFAIFWDFVVGLQPSIERCRIHVTMFSGTSAVAEAKALPLVPCSKVEEAGVPGKSSLQAISVLGIKQHFSRCQPMQAVSILVQLAVGQLHGSFAETVKEVGWTKLDVFDSTNRVIAGRWKTPMRVCPSRPDLSTIQMNTMAQLDQCELHYRLINARDVELQEGVVLLPLLISSYRYPPLEIQVQPTQKAMLTTTMPLWSHGKEAQVHVPSGSTRKASSGLSHKIEHRMEAEALHLRTPVVGLPRQGSQREGEIELLRTGEPKEFADVELHPLTPMQGFSLQSTRLGREERMAVTSRSVYNDKGNATHDPKSFATEPIEVSVDRRSSLPPTRSAIPSLPSLNESVIIVDFGLQLDKLLDGPTGECRIQLSLYQPDGKIAHYSQGRVSYASLRRRPTFLKDIHSFGLEERFERYFPIVSLTMGEVPVETLPKRRPRLMTC